MVNNIKNWRCICNNLLNHSVETIFTVLYRILYDITSCNGMGYGYDKYYIVDYNGNFKNLYSLPEEYIKMLFEHYKELYIKQKGGKHEKTNDI